MTRALMEPAIASARSARIFCLAFMVGLLWVLPSAARRWADVDGIQGATYVRTRPRTTRFCAPGVCISALFSCAPGPRAAMLVRGAMVTPDAGPTQPFLARLASDEVAVVRSRAVPRHFERGATLMHQDEVPGRVIIVERGHAKVTLLSEEGKEIVLAFRGPGDLLGEVSALGGHPRSATVRALEPMEVVALAAGAPPSGAAAALEPMEVLALAAGDFDALLEEHPRIALVILRGVIERLREANQQQFEFAAYQTLGRVARRLVELADRFGEPCDAGVRIGLGLSQEELAGWAGASREATSKALHDLRTMHLIETERRHITVRSVDELRRMR